MRWFRVLWAVGVFSGGFVHLGYGEGLWRIEYNTLGSLLHVRETPFGGLGDGSFPQESGRVVIEFADAGGQPGAGAAAIVEYATHTLLATGPVFAHVESDLRSKAEFDATRPRMNGQLDGDIVTWTDPMPYHVTGVTVCTGVLCSAAGFEDGVPAPEDYQIDLPFNPFEFGPGGPAAGAGFTMAEIEVPNDDAGRTFVELVGTEVNRIFVPDPVVHTADLDGDARIDLSELVRVVQLYNSEGYHCDASGEDGFAVDGGDHNCWPHAADYNPQDWLIDLSELLRIFQFYNLSGYIHCPDQMTEDGYCPLSE